MTVGGIMINIYVVYAHGFKIRLTCLSSMHLLSWVYNFILYASFYVKYDRPITSGWEQYMYTYTADMQVYTRGISDVLINRTLQQ